MTILVVGASGATGRLVVQQLLAQLPKENETVKIIVRSKAALSQVLPIETIQDSRLEITEGCLLNMTDSQLQSQVKGCRAVVSCLGHNLNFNGMFGRPRRLVTDAVQRLCHAIEATGPDVPIKFILMNTTGNQNLKAGEKVSMPQALVVGLIRMLLPPHADNEEAAGYLQSRYGCHQKTIEWVTVRPDSLINEESVTEYDVYASPVRSAIFDAGKTSRINVAHFMSQLIINNCTWNKWKTQMPVIYNNSI
ncbi:NAD(P)-dependent oxidoreductase [Colwellia piezophila]|uniref:NAD(P)-dependent oxidoreductase n=1 Tax=Colwellia piezophila TaxID=211668 RepID=UPI00036958F4|nr:NAD(P)-binding oxidoreductase [Colwellia piezophila]